MKDLLYTRTLFFKGLGISISRSFILKQLKILTKAFNWGLCRSVGLFLTPIPCAGLFYTPLPGTGLFLPNSISCVGLFLTPLPCVGFLYTPIYYTWSLSYSCTLCWSFYLLLYLSLVFFLTPIPCVGLLSTSIPYTVSFLILYLLFCLTKGKYSGGMPPALFLFHTPLPDTSLFT